MKAKSIKGKSTEEIKMALNQRLVFVLFQEVWTEQQ